MNNKSMLKNKKFWIFTAFCAVILLVGWISNELAIAYLFNHNLDKGERIHDIILDNISYYNVSVFVDITMVAAILLYLIYLFSKKSYADFPVVLLALGIFEILRAIFIILTPTPAPCPGCKFGYIRPDFAGNFPSGHFAIPVFIFSYFLVKREYKLSICLGILALINFIAIMLSFGHYTVDMVGTILLAYSIFLTLKHYGFFRKS